MITISTIRLNSIVTVSTAVKVHLSCIVMWLTSSSALKFDVRHHHVRHWESAPIVDNPVSQFCLRPLSIRFKTSSLVTATSRRISSIVRQYGEWVSSSLPVPALKLSQVPSQREITESPVVVLGPAPAGSEWRGGDGMEEELLEKCRRFLHQIGQRFELCPHRNRLRYVLCLQRNGLRFELCPQHSRAHPASWTSLPVKLLTCGPTYEDRLG